MSVHLWIWIATIVVIAGFFVFDFYSHVRTPHEPTIKEAALWSAFYVGLALVFGGFVFLMWDTQHGVEYLTGYVTEKALSVDNLFVFALIIGAFKIPRKYQQKVLLIGIALALIFRLAFILLGAAVIAAWSDVFYLFAVFLLWTAIKLIWDEASDKPETDPNDMKLIKWLRRVVPVTPGYHGDSLITKFHGKRALTPLFVALVAIGLVDIMFAFDSIPAIYGITTEAYLVFATNAFSLMGLRQLYFLLDGLLDRLVYLPYGLGLILAFIGAKLLLHALHENNLPFINGGENVAVPEIPTELSLLVILGILVVTVLLSLWRNKYDHAQGALDTRIRPEEWDHELSEHEMFDAAEPASPASPENNGEDTGETRS
ncbi:TerC family protein [Corynebacterium alimapuense]|uniref:Tellurium resistance protein TerC n=1 Tax=Corynebacterium alimapuense TaxID=1576874 RepID=A0A3M8K9Z6_9CORY|nr:TerC family protein [Corynebacterium alimapuense]RNE49354.1 tellurium resistance protein TerC [Corynebacterium alimapuense]